MADIRRCSLSVPLQPSLHGRKCAFAGLPGQTHAPQLDHLQTANLLELAFGNPAVRIPITGRIDHETPHGRQPHLQPRLLRARSVLDGFSRPLGYYPSQDSQSGLSAARTSFYAIVRKRRFNPAGSMLIEHVIRPVGEVSVLRAPSVHDRVNTSDRSECITVGNRVFMAVRHNG